MSYQINCSDFKLEKILERILKTDLIPSLESIKSEAENILNKFKSKGLDDLQKIRNVLKNKKSVHEIVKELNINENVLTLFRREIEGWTVKIRSIDEYDWISSENLLKLKKCGIRNSEDAFLKLSKKESRKTVSEDNSINEEILEEIYGISNLMRIRWLSPNFTRIIYELRYTVDKIQTANSKSLCQEIESYNQERKYYKGKVGERDIGRIIAESQYVKI